MLLLLLSMAFAAPAKVNQRTYFLKTESCQVAVVTSGQSIETCAVESVDEKTKNDFSKFKSQDKAPKEFGCTYKITCIEMQK